MIMKKNILLPAALLLLLAGCDYNDKHFDGLDDLTRPTDVKNIEYTLADADYAAIASNKTNKELAKANEAEAELAKLGTTKRFSETLPASIYAPAFIAGKWYTADDGSSVKLTYNRGVDVPEYLGEIEAAADYEVTAADYVSVWGSTPANYFTPSKTSAGNLPKLLAKAIQEPEEGDYLRVTYQYSDREPGGETELVLTIVDEDFETVIKDKEVALEGWFNKDLSGDRSWMGKNYNNNSYAQVSGSGKNDSWLISPVIDLSEAEEPTLSFDICTGHNKGGKLQVLISEDFNGMDPAGATWQDVSANFYIPTTPENGYGKLSPAGIMDMSAYKSRFYLAFKYSGDGDAGQTATYQIDNLQVGDVNTVQENLTFGEDFEAIADGKAPIDIAGWSNTGEKNWYGASYGGNIFAEVTAYNNGVVSTSLITPAITVPQGAILTFDINPRYYSGDCLKVYLSEVSDAADGGDGNVDTWTDVTDKFNIPQAQTSAFVSAGYMGLESYTGKNIAVRFHYEGDSGDSRTTTIRIDNIKVVTYSRVVTRSAAATRYVGTVVERTDVYQYKGTSWVKAGNVSVVNPEDYEQMGAPGANNYFTSSISAANYLPTYLAGKFPYAQEDDQHAVAYKYYNGTETSVRVDEYIYKSGAWAKNDNVEVVTDQFVLSDRKWNFDPSILLTLKPGRSQPDVALYYQAIVDYVAATYGTGYYQTGYTNAEYYYGASSYQNNFDLRISAWRNSHAKGSEYEGLTDEQLEALMNERLQEAFIPALKANHADMAPIDGIDVICTIRFGVYKGSTISECTHEIQYKVTAPGEFEYIEDSLKELK